MTDFTIKNDHVIKHSLMVACFNGDREKVEISRHGDDSYLAVRYGEGANGDVEYFSSQESDPEVILVKALALFNLKKEDLKDLKVDSQVIDIEESVKRAFERSSIRLLRNETKLQEVNALVLVIDLRGFSDFIKNDHKNQAIELIRTFNGNVLTLINHLEVSFYKLLGDGVLAIWDNLDSKKIHHGLKFFEEMVLSIDDLKGIVDYKGGFGGALVAGPVLKYEMSSEMAGLHFVDYVGYNVNFAFRLQGKAKAKELLVNETVKNLLPPQYKTSPRYFALKGISREDCKLLHLVSGFSQ